MDKCACSFSYIAAVHITRALVSKRVGAKTHRLLAAKLKLSHFHCTHHNNLMSLVGKRVGATLTTGPRQPNSITTSL